MRGEVVGRCGADDGGAHALARERLSPAKRPKDYVAVEALPMTATGKVRRLALPGLLDLDGPE